MTINLTLKVSTIPFSVGEQNTDTSLTSPQRKTQEIAQEALNQETPTRDYLSEHDPLSPSSASDPLTPSIRDVIPIPTNAQLADDSTPTQQHTLNETAHRALALQRGPARSEFPAGTANTSPVYEELQDAYSPTSKQQDSPSLSTPSSDKDFIPIPIHSNLPTAQSRVCDLTHQLDSLLVLIEQKLMQIPHYQYKTPRQEIAYQELNAFVDQLLAPLYQQSLGPSLNKKQSNTLLDPVISSIGDWIGLQGINTAGTKVDVIPEELQKAFGALEVLKHDFLPILTYLHSQQGQENLSKEQIYAYKLYLREVWLWIGGVKPFCFSYLDKIRLPALVPLYLAIEPLGPLRDYLDRETDKEKVRSFLIHTVETVFPDGTPSPEKLKKLGETLHKYPQAKKLRDQYLEVNKLISPLLKELTAFQTNLKETFELIKELKPSPQKASSPIETEDLDLSYESECTPSKRRKKKKQQQDDSTSPCVARPLFTPPIEDPYTKTQKRLSSLKQKSSNRFATRAIDNASYHALILMQSQTAPTSKEELLSHVANCIQHSQLMIEQLLLSSLLDKSTEEPEILASHNLLKLAQSHPRYDSLQPLLRELQLGDLSTRGVDAQHETQATRLMLQAIRALDKEDINALESSLDEYLKRASQALSFIAPGLSLPSLAKTSLTHSVCPYPKAFNSLSQCIKQLYSNPLPQRLATNLLPRLGREMQRDKTLSPSQAHLHLYNMTFLTRLIAEELLSNAMQSSDHFTQHPHDLLGACQQIKIKTEPLQLFLQTAAQSLRHIRYPYTHDAGIDSPQLAIKAADWLIKLPNAWHIQHEKGFQFESRTNDLLNIVKKRTQADFKALCTLTELLTTGRDLSESQ